LSDFYQNRLTIGDVSPVFENEADFENEANTWQRILEGILGKTIV